MGKQILEQYRQSSQKALPQHVMLTSVGRGMYVAPCGPKIVRGVTTEAAGLLKQPDPMYNVAEQQIDRKENQSD
jgi:hypothetical protein